MKTIQMTAAEIAERTARFDALQPMSTMKDNARVSQAAKDIIFARKIMAERLETIQPGVLPEFQAFGLAFTAGMVDDRTP
jgi:hypothetical protein